MENKWKAKLVKKIINNGLLTIGIVYTKGDESFRESYFSRDGKIEIKTIVKNRLAELKSLETVLDTINEEEIKTL